MGVFGGALALVMLPCIIEETFTLASWLVSPGTQGW